MCHICILLLLLKEDSYVTCLYKCVRNHSKSKRKWVQRTMSTASWMTSHMLKSLAIKQVRVKRMTMKQQMRVVVTVIMSWFSLSLFLIRSFVFSLCLQLSLLLHSFFFSMINWVLIETDQRKMNCIIKEEIKNILSLIKRRKKKREYRISLIIVLHILEITWICYLVLTYCYESYRYCKIKLSSKNRLHIHTNILTMFCVFKALTFVYLSLVCYLALSWNNNIFFLSLSLSFSFFFGLLYSLLLTKCKW